MAYEGSVQERQSNQVVRPGLSSLALSLLVHAFLALALLTWTAILHRVSLDDRKLTWIDLEPKETRMANSQDGEKTDQPAKDALLGKQTQRVDRQTTAKLRKLDEVELRYRRGGGAAAEKAVTQEKAPPLSSLGIPLLPALTKDSSRKVSRTPGPFQDEEIFKQPSGEYIRGIKESDVTALNTREYIFFGFFQRIRERLDLAWSRVLRENLGKMARRGRMLASEKEHTTRLKVVLNEKGIITQVTVLEESGSFDLDDAAVRAFNQSGPFPNPPKGLVDSRGVVEIQWDFILRT